METLVRLDANIPDCFHLKTNDRLKFEFSELFDAESSYESNREISIDSSKKKPGGSNKENSVRPNIDLNTENIGGSHWETSGGLDFIRESIVLSYMETADESNIDTSDEIVQKILDCIDRYVITVEEAISRGWLYRPLCYNSGGSNL